MRRYAVIATTLILLVSACGDDAATDGPSTTATTASTATSMPVSTTAPPTTTAAPTTTTAETTTTTTSSSSTAPDTPTVIGLGPARDLTLTTADGLSLEARHWPGGTTWVVLGHMRPADMTSWFAFADTLHGLGFSVLTYNNRGYGASDGDRSAFDLVTDADAALALAQSTGAAKRVYVGASMNGAAAFVIAANNDLAGFATLSAVPAFPSADAVAAAPDVDEIGFVIAAEDDGSAVADAELLAGLVPGRVEKLFITRGGHGTAMLSDPTVGVSLVEFVNNVGR